MKDQINIPRVTKMIAFGIFITCLSSLLVLWSMFFTMWLRGETKIIVYANKFGEFSFEFVLLTLSIIFLPVLLYEVEDLIKNNE